MEKNIFWLENDQLKEIASSFQEKVEEGLKHENAEIHAYRLLSLPKPLILMEKHWFSI